MITKFTKFINENNIIDTSLSILDETKIPYLFRIYLDSYENKLELLKYISEQGQGLYELENKEQLYNSTCRIFTKKLTDAAIKAFPL